MPTTRPFVRRIKSNLKSPTPWEIEIGQKTLIVGSNASHKSSVTQSVEIALTGSVDDVVGRTAVRSPELLLTMVADDILSVEATLSNDKVCRYDVRKGKRPKAAPYSADILPLRQVREALTGSAATAKRAFVKWVAAHVTQDDVLSLLPKDLHKRFKQLADPEASAIDNLLHIFDFVSKQQRGALKEAKGAQTIVDELENSLTEIPDEKLLTSLANQLEQFGRSAGVSDVRALDEAIEQTRENVSLWQSEFNKQALPAAAEQLLYLAEADALDTCPACASEVGYEHLYTCLKHYQVLLSDDSEGPSYAKAKETLAAWKDELSRLLELRSYADVADHRAMIEKQYQELVVAKARWDNINLARRRAEALTADAEAFSSLKKHCSEAIQGLLDTRLDQFTVRVDQYLPANWTFKIQSTDKVFRVGLKTGSGPFRAALSGAEWAAVTTAVAMGACESMGVERPIVLIPEDRAWDSRTLAAVMRGFGSFEGQVIIASTIRPHGRPSSAWTIINLDKEPLLTKKAQTPPSTPPTDPTPPNSSDSSEAAPAEEVKAPTPKVKTKTRRRRKQKSKSAPMAKPTTIAQELPRLQ
jgi:hypothetical protein